MTKISDQRQKGVTKITSATWFLAYLGFFVTLCGGVQLYTGAYTSDLSQTGDEAAHFVNSTMISDYIRHGLGTNPVHFALDYYAHLPRVSIGHWPPFFHMVQAGLFLVAGASFAAAHGFQALIAAATAALTGAIVGLRAGGGMRGATIGLAAGTAVLASPDLLGHISAIMLDIFLSGLVLLTALAWAAYARTGKASWSVAFALCASAAILTKGNAYGLGMLPPLFCVLSGQYGLVANWRTWLSAVIVVVFTVPWYALTYKMSADGFVYRWGIEYISRSIPAFSRAALSVLGPIALIGFVSGTAMFARRAQRGEQDEVVLACASAAISLFVFQLVVPADIAPRYLIAAIPCAMVVSTLGLLWLINGLATRTATPVWLTVAVVTCLAGNAALTFRMPRSAQHPMNDAARDILATPDSAELVLVAAGPNGEGALIAAFAAFDKTRAHYVIRASKAFASSNFMGSIYQARFNTPEEVLSWIADHRIGWLVLDDGPDSAAMLHDKQVAALVDANQPGWHLLSTHPYRQGSVRVFRLDGKPATPSEIRDVLQQTAPNKILGGGAEK